jgi:hypothetical protein
MVKRLDPNPAESVSAGNQERHRIVPFFELNNPWPEISVSDYETHMSHPAVRQLQVINSMFRSQYEDYLPDKLLCIGIGTGNGLEHVRQEITGIVYGIDINESFLQTSRSRYAEKIGGLLTRLVDVNHDYFTEATVDLVIANLVLEFIELERFIGQLELVSRTGTIVSVVFQIIHDAPFVSCSGVRAINGLSGFKREVRREALEKKLQKEGFTLIKELHHMLHDGKELVRMDFRKT